MYLLNRKLLLIKYVCSQDRCHEPSNIIYLIFSLLFYQQCCVQGGIAYNIVPAELSASFDFRIPPSVDFDVSVLFPTFN